MMWGSASKCWQGDVGVSKCWQGDVEVSKSASAAGKVVWKSWRVLGEQVGVGRVVTIL